MTTKLRFLGLCVSLVVYLAFQPLTLAQTQAASLRGAILDPSGAAVPGADITITHGDQAMETRSGTDGRYAFRNVPAGVYTLSVNAKGFAILSRDNVALAAGQTADLNLALTIAIQQQQVEVQGQANGVSINPDQNSSSTVLKGSALDALSDDPNELQNELEALAGPAAGPNGGEIYIDGFSGGQLPPKSSILEVRVNQNPFSAEFDHIGYGRIEIITKPGSEKLHGSVSSYGNSSVFNTANPLVSEQPSYSQYAITGDVSGPLSKTASYFFSGYRVSRQNQSIIDAIDPENTAANIREAFPNPVLYIAVAPRVDFQLSKSNTVTIRDSFDRATQTGNGVGGLNLSQQASSVANYENAFQIGETFIAGPHLLNETHFQWRRIRNSQLPDNLTPTITVQGAFTGGGSSAGVARDNQDIFELQNYSTATAAAHAIRFGMRLRAYRDANYSTAGSNGTYTFNSLASYNAQAPDQYSATVIENPLARLLLFDGALFFQDDWRAKPNLIASFGLRFEGQNRIHDHADWAPRLALAWSPGRTANLQPKTVVRMGYGWFYNRFTIPSFFNSAAGAPWLIEAIHDNQINQQSYVVNQPGATYFDQDAAEPASELASSSSSVPSYHSIDSHFHAAYDMQTGIGVDRQLTKAVSGNVTYLYTQGVHQYLTNNVTAPAFDAVTYRLTTSAPSIYNYQFQSGGVYRQNQLIVTTSAKWKRFVLNGSYTLNQAKSDTQGVTSVPSVAQNPGLDYGRARFGYRDGLLLLDSYSAPWGIVVASLMAAQSGTPYNVTIANDLTGNNQFNARPTYGVCGAAGVITTRYGCLDTTPQGKGERITPYDIGVGPANAVFHLRISKVFGVGPRIKTAAEGNTFQNGNGVSGRGLSSGGAAINLDATAPRRFNLTFVVGANNLFNMVNLAPPNGVLLSPLFGKTQSLATGQFSNPTPGNRSITFQANFAF